MGPPGGPIFGTAYRLVKEQKKSTFLGPSGGRPQNRKINSEGRPVQRTKNDNCVYSRGTSKCLQSFFSVQRLHGFRQVVTHVQPQQKSWIVNWHARPSEQVGSLKNKPNQKRSKQTNQKPHNNNQNKPNRNRRVGLQPAMGPTCMMTSCVQVSPKLLGVGEVFLVSWKCQDAAWHYGLYEIWRQACSWSRMLAPGNSMRRICIHLASRTSWSSILHPSDCLQRFVPLPSAVFSYVQTSNKLC